MSQPHDTALSKNLPQLGSRERLDTGGKAVAVPKPSACFLSPELIKTLLNDPSSVKTDEVRRVTGAGERAQGERKGPRMLSSARLAACLSEWGLRHPLPSRRGLQ